MPDPTKKTMVSVPKRLLSDDEIKSSKSKKVVNGYKDAPASRIQEGVELGNRNGEKVTRIYYKDGTAGDATPDQMRKYRETESYANVVKENKAQLAKEASERLAKKSKAIASK